MCEGCRRRLKKIYGDNEIYDEAERFYGKHPEAGVLGHIVYEDDNLEPEHIMWTIGCLSHEIFSNTLPADYTKEQAEVVRAHLRKLYEMATEKLGWVLPEQEDGAF